MLRSEAFPSPVGAGVGATSTGVDARVLVYVAKKADAALLTSGPTPPTGAQSRSERTWISWISPSATCSWWDYHDWGQHTVLFRQGASVLLALGDGRCEGSVSTDTVEV